MSGWIGVDLDGTLAYYDRASGGIGKPLAPMMARVKDWLAAGIEVRIFTARASDPSLVPEVQAWLKSVGLPALQVTNKKDFKMIALWDDRAVRVQHNTGHVCGSCVRMRR